MIQILKILNQRIILKFQLLWSYSTQLFELFSHIFKEQNYLSAYLPRFKPGWRREGRGVLGVVYSPSYQGKTKERKKKRKERYSLPSSYQYIWVKDLVLSKYIFELVMFYKRITREPSIYIYYCEDFNSWTRVYLALHYHKGWCLLTQEYIQLVKLL